MAVKKVRKRNGNKLQEDLSLGCRLNGSLRAPVLFVTLCVSVCHWLPGCEHVYASLLRYSVFCIVVGACLVYVPAGMCAHLNCDCDFVHLYNFCRSYLPPVRSSHPWF